MAKLLKTSLSAGLRPVILGFILFHATTALAEGLSLNQCANGGIADPVDHKSCSEGWINGNLNASKAAYAEGQYVPYRVQMTGLTPGQQYTYSFSWDVLKSGKHALDYIGTYDYSVVDADACDGVAGPCPGTMSTIAIPADPSVGGIEMPVLREFTLFGGTLDSVGPFTSPSADVRAITVTFTPDQSNAVLAWGGHISTPIDWGDGNTASDIKGSPYHMSNMSLVVTEGGQSVAGGGQDVQLSAAAVFVPSLINVTKVSNLDGTFTFESAIGGQVLIPIGDLGSPWTLERGESKTLDAMDAGEVTITETGLPAGDWRIKSIFCSQLGVGEVFSYVFPDDSVTDTAEFNVGEAGTYNCVFENEFFGAPVLEVIKKVVAADADCTTDVRDSADYETISVRSGETVKYCIWVTNTGADDAWDVIVVDDLSGLGAPTEVTMYGADLGGDGNDPLIPDLPIGGWISGELEVAVNVVLNTILVNTATAEGIGAIDKNTYSDHDSAEVRVEIASTCGLTGSVYAGAGTCATNGAPTAYIIKDSGTDANWCADVSWDANAELDLQDILVTIDGTILSNSGADMSPGGSQVIGVGPTNPNADVTETLVLTGSEGGLNDITCAGPATVDVIAPGLQLIKRASTNNVCGDSDDAASVEIINGDDVWYCLTVANTGDVPLVDVLIDDPTIGIANYNAGALAVSGPGSSSTHKFGPYQPLQDVTNTAYATATHSDSGYQINPPEQSSATVIVLSADLEVSKWVDPGHIVYCQLNDWKHFCTEQNGGGNYDAVYTVSVHNNGPSPATGVTLDDDLPFGFIYDGNDSGCLYDVPTHSLSCALGEIAPAGTVVIEVHGEIDPGLFDLPWQEVTNQACGLTDPIRLDPDPSNNCDTATTQISTGPTRTIGWWSTHPNGLAACLADTASVPDGFPTGLIDLGYVEIRDEAFDNDVDATVSTNTTAKGKHKSSLIQPKKLNDLDGEATTAEVMAKGMLNARVANWRDGTRRSHIGSARTQTARQLTAAWCNEVTFGSEFDYYYLGWANIRLIMNGEAYLQGGTVKSCDGPCTNHLNQVIQSIKLIGGVADLFNNAGDDLDNGQPSERANPKAPQDDPTDPTD